VGGIRHVGDRHGLVVDLHADITGGRLGAWLPAACVCLLSPAVALASGTLTHERTGGPPTHQKS
jgi:hypothetical protein